MDFWTADRIETMRVMLSAKHTAIEIAAALGHGCTKRAVIGKANRLGLSAPGMARTWTPERDETLKSMHAANYVFEAIAAVLGVSRKAVANRASVLKLPRRPRNFRGIGSEIKACTATLTSVTRTVTPRKPRAFRPRLVVTLEAPSTDIAASILDVTGCRWAITPHDAGKGDHMFCNHPVQGKGSYCPYHAEMNRAKPVPVAERKLFKIPVTSLRAVA